MNRAERAMLVLTLIPLVGLLLLLLGCSPCVSVYVAGCQPFPDAALME